MGPGGAQFWFGKEAALLQMNRLFEMVYLLMERGTLTAAELAERFEVSTRTVYRDVELLSQAGIPVYALKGRGGGIGLMPQFVLDRSLLTPGEQDEILLALQSLQATGAGAGPGVLERVSALFRRQAPTEWIEVDFTSWGSGEQEKAAFQLLRTAILERQAVAFSYYNAWGECSERTVEPGKLCFKSAAWYLQAWCRLREDWRFFRLSRMENLRLTGDRFAPRAVPPPAYDQAPPGSLVTLWLRFSPRAAYRVWEEFERRAIQRQPDGSLLVRATFPENDWVLGYLLSFGGEVQVQSPERYRLLLQQEAQKIATSYERGR